MWVKKDTRAKFVFVKKGAPLSAFPTISEENLSVDFGGKARSKDGDAFVGRAMRKYDEDKFDFLHWFQEKKEGEGGGGGKETVR